MLSPYHGGSHAVWAEGWAGHSRHHLELLTLPARFWKWRMHGAAVTLARRAAARADAPPDVIVATDMLDLSAFLGLSRRHLGPVPVLLYMHENQITYPLPADPTVGPMRRQAGERDRHYGFINLSSMLAADAVAFNSRFHRRELLEALPAFLRHFPDHRETGCVRRLARHSVVLAPGVELPQVPATREHAGPPLVLWNQRWEYDKNPEALFEALLAAAELGAQFELAVCGQQFGRRAEALEWGIAALGDRVVHAGYLPRQEYRDLLGRADVVISTAEHEFFGIAVAEAMAAGAVPLLPDRLSYPELVPPRYHGACLYEDTGQLPRRLADLVADLPAARARVAGLARAVRRRFGWPQVARRYDAYIDELVGGSCGPASIGSSP